MQVAAQNYLSTTTAEIRDYRLVIFPQISCWLTQQDLVGIVTKKCGLALLRALTKS